MEERLKILKEKVKKYLLERNFVKPKRVLEKEKKIKVYLAFEHSPSFVEEIKKKIKEKFGEGNEIEIKIDKSLIGGLRIITKNMLIKGSLKDFLLKLKNVNI